MKRVWSGMFAALAFTTVAALSAQSTPPPADQPQASADKVTVTGCLERAKEGASPTGTTGGAAPDSTKFVLNNAMAAPSATGTAGTSGSARAASSYRIDGEDSKLTPHLGHKIEITGTVDSAGAMGASKTAAPKLKVESVKMVAATCTP